MFLGEYTHTIDSKGRITIPAKFRNLLAAGLVVTRGFDQNLMLFPMDGWQELAERIAQRPLSDEGAASGPGRFYSLETRALVLNHVVLWSCFADVPIRCLLLAIQFIPTDGKAGPRIKNSDVIRGSSLLSVGNIRGHIE